MGGPSPRPPPAAGAPGGPAAGPDEGEGGGASAARAGPDEGEGEGGGASAARAGRGEGEGEGGGASAARAGPDEGEGEGGGEGSVWALPVGEAPWAFVDLEMTGLDPASDRVCEVCVVRTRGGRVEGALESLVSPGGARPDARAGRVHGLSEGDWGGSPGFAGVAERLAELLDGAIVVAHGVELDLAFLRAEFGRLGREPPRLEGTIDTLLLARRCFALPSYRLERLSAALGLEHPRPHRAGDDARATMQLFWRAVGLLEPSSAGDLRQVRVGERRARPELVERAAQARARGEPVAVRYRPSRRGPEGLTMVITEVRTDLDPPRVLGYLVPGRGRRELRADRILAIGPLNPNPDRSP
ncbi:MAG TPA: 3'-5' exonuclease [Polyangiaceae bacterium]|nr:3'-5' exonuclease [Polyangiaceae bacterium]